SLRKLLLGVTFRPEKRANPSSAASDMTWLLRSTDQSLRARQARKAWAGGIILEPGSRAAWASVSTGRRARWGKNKNKPPQSVKNWRGTSESARTSATASRV